jgi:hypothetical protein
MMEKIKSAIIPYSFVKMKNPDEEFKTPELPTKNPAINDP